MTALITDDYSGSSRHFIAMPNEGEDAATLPRTTSTATTTTTTKKKKKITPRVSLSRSLRENQFVGASTDESADESMLTGWKIEADESEKREEGEEGEEGEEEGANEGFFRVGTNVIVDAKGLRDESVNRKMAAMTIVGAEAGSKIARKPALEEDELGGTENESEDGFGAISEAIAAVESENSETQLRAIEENPRSTTTTTTTTTTATKGDDGGDVSVPNHGSFHDESGDVNDGGEKEEERRNKNDGGDDFAGIGGNSTRRPFSSQSITSATAKQNPSSSDALANADAVLMACLWERGQVVDLALKRLPVLPESASKVGAHVTHLYLNGNRLKTLPADFFSEMQVMEYLDLRDNLLVSLPAGNPLASHKALKAILLQNNQLQSLPMELGNILTLATLSFSGNPLSFPPPEVILYGCKAILLFLQECWYSRLLESQSVSLRGKGGDEEEAGEWEKVEDDEADENVDNEDDDDEVDADERRGPNRSQTPDVNRRKSSDIAGERRRTKSAVATPSPTGGRRLSQSSQQQQQLLQQKPDVTFPIGQSPVALQRQKSYGEFKADLISKLEKAGVPVARRPTSRSGSGRGRRKVEGGGGGGVDGGRGREEKTSRGMGWRPAGPDYDPDAKEKESPEYFARMAKDPKTRLRGTRTTSRRVAGDQPEFPASATTVHSLRRPTNRRMKDDPTIDLTTVNAKAAAERRRAIDKEKADKTEKLLQRQRTTAAMQQWRDEEKLKAMKTKFAHRQMQQQQQQVQQQALLRRQRAEKTPFEVDPDLKMESKKDKIHEDAKTKSQQRLNTKGKGPDASPDGYERLLAARISEDRNLHRKIHEHKRRIEAQRVKAAGAGGKSLDAQQHLLDAQQQLAEALELQQQVRQARGQNTLEAQHGRTFASKT